ncbi:MAG: ankyrin repeat domain-containing protein [Alphaproteobacteria bacterium]
MIRRVFTAVTAHTPSEHLHAAVWANDATAIGAILATPVGREALNEPDKFGNTPLLNAVEYAHPEAAKALLQAGANRDIAGRRGMSALELAEHDGKVSLSGILSPVTCGEDFNPVALKKLSQIRAMLVRPAANAR